MKAFAPALAMLSAVSLVAGPAGQSAAKPSHEQGSCFWTRDVSNFAAADDENLYVRVGVSDVYWLKLFGNCLDVAWVHHIALRTRTSSNICEGHNPDLDVIDREIGIGRQLCPVLDVRKLTHEQVAALPKLARP